jgi:hypothetical protein
VGVPLCSLLCAVVPAWGHAPEPSAALRQISPPKVLPLPFSFQISSSFFCLSSFTVNLFWGTFYGVFPLSTLGASPHILLDVAVENLFTDQ